MTLDDVQQWLESHAWAEYFDGGTLARGDAYALRGHVHKLGVSDRPGGGCMLLAQVKGRPTRPYACMVALQLVGDKLLIDSHCTCPIGTRCKHAAATLARAEMGGKAHVETSAGTEPAAPAAPKIPVVEPYVPPRNDITLHIWESWLHQLNEPKRYGISQPIVDADRLFGVLLRAEPLTRQLLALPVWMRPAKTRRGSPWVAPLPVRDGYGPQPLPMPAGGWPQELGFALAVLLTAPVENYANQDWCVIEEPHVERALDMLLAQCTVWYERGDKPLTRGDEMATELVWREDEHGAQRLAMQLPRAGAELLLGVGMWYVDVAGGHYGRATGSAKLFEHLHTAPAIPPAQAEGAQKILAANAAATLVPPPRAGGPIMQVRATPTPVLHLHTGLVEPWLGNWETCALATLHFDYAGHRVDAEDHRDSPSRRTAEGVFVIQRDAVSERPWLARLDAVKLVALDRYSIPCQRTDKCGYLKGQYAAAATGDRLLKPEEWGPVIASLEKQGFRIEYGADFPHEKRVAIDAWHAELEPDGNAWFDVALGVDIEGERINLIPLLRQLIADPKFPLAPKTRERENATWPVRIDAERHTEIPLAQLRALIEPLLEWLSTEPHGKPRVHGSDIAALESSGLPWHGGEALRARLAELRQRQPNPLPKGLKASLRPYQKDGLAWLDFLGAAGLGGILADDMGLGKTVQVLAHIVGAKERGELAGPVLVVAPTTLVGNWQAETARFAPGLKVLVLHGADRATRFAQIDSHDLVITTYPLLPRDEDALAEARFALLVLDEAQAIKNAASVTAKAVRKLHATRRLAMTGTPLENHLGELWAQFDAVEPGLLGSARQFAKYYRTPIEKHGDTERSARLNRKLAPLLLRRRKDDVLTDLPAKTEIVQQVELEGAQRALYETLRAAQHERVKQAIAERGLAQSGIVVIDALLKLRQACCDPRLVKLPSAAKVKASAKLDALLELLESLISDGRRVLLFSQFTAMLALIETALDQRQLRYQTLTGDTPSEHRSALVKRFQQGDVPLFLISLKAGGTGLNLTAADTVIHYDPWWNPAAEAQASDRAHRIGQTKPVFVYRLICTGTVEEKIQAMQTRKAALARAVLEGGGSSAKLRFDEGDLEALFGG